MSKLHNATNSSVCLSTTLLAAFHPSRCPITCQPGYHDWTLQGSQHRLHGVEIQDQHDLGKLPKTTINAAMFKDLFAQCVMVL